MREEREYAEDFIPKTKREIDDFIEANKKLIGFAIKRYKSMGEYADLFQIGMIGFYKGIQSYDPNNGTRLQTYCCKCAQNEVKMAIRHSCAKSRKAFVQSYDEVFSNSLVDRPKNGCDNIYSSDVDQLHEEVMSLEIVVERKEMARAALDYAKRCLPEVEYKALIMKASGATQEQISNKLHISQATVSKTIRMAHGKLKYFLLQNGYDNYAS